jgi:hypothetical protein
MIGDPPFVGMNDAEALAVSEQMFGFQGLLYKFPPRCATPNLAIFLTDLKGMEEWKGGRLEERNRRRIGGAITRNCSAQRMARRVVAYVTLRRPPARSAILLAGQLSREFYHNKRRQPDRRLHLSRPARWQDELSHMLAGHDAKQGTRRVQ